MNALLLDLLPYVHRGYCCSQLLLVLAAQATDREDPGLLSALRGLCHGIGQSGGPCGLLTGGAAVLAWLVCRDADEPHPMLDAMTGEYAAWFAERVGSCGGTGCEQVSSGLAADAGISLPEGGMPPLDLCGDLLADCWGKILDICEAYDVDIRS